MELDNYLLSGKKYIIKKVVNDSTEKTINRYPIITDLEFEDILNSAIIITDIFSDNRVCIISDVSFCHEKKNYMLSFIVEGYDKKKPYTLYEGYEWTKCPYYYKFVNRAYFLVEKEGEKFKLSFIKWLYE